ncbi:MAG TPA: HNH endonuclease [Aestuariivirga sp.]|nr:HNH endonuclease [Aestuariivirga sp.]
MASSFLNGLTKEDRVKLERTLWENQGGVCFISQKKIDLEIDKVDIDHIIPSRDKGKDEPSNFALTLEHFNRSKQASDLRVARVMARFEEIREQSDSDDRGVNLNDVLKSYGGAKAPLAAKIEENTLTYVNNDQDKISLTLHTDKLSGMKYFFTVAPITAVFHDDKTNPRPIGSNIRGLVEEFHKGRPQLHVSLGWIKSTDLPEMRINLFDGQHKAAAQILLGAKELPVRVFVDPNLDVLLTTNFNAGTTLRQVAFDKSVQRRLGSHMLRDRIERFRNEKGLAPDYYEFSEKDVIEYFKGEQKSVKRYILDNVRDAITYSEQNKLRDYIEIAGKGTEKPFSYSAIEKTIYSKFISSLVLETPWNYKEDVGENPRSIEITQISRLMSIIADTIYVGK